MRTLAVVTLVVWLFIGAIAAMQRGYFGADHKVTCHTTGDTLLTVAVGPLNYVGLNPEVKCHLP